MTLCRLFVLAAVAAALVAGCARDPEPVRIPLDQIKVKGNPHLRTSPVGGQMEADEIAIRKRLGEPEFDRGDAAAVNAAYVLVDAENLSPHDAYVSLDGTLNAGGGGDGGGQTAPLKAESLFVPSGATRTFLLLDEGLAPRPWAQGVEVKLTGVRVAAYPPPIDITELHVFDDGDHVVAAATATPNVKRAGRGLVHCAFHDKGGNPIGRGHMVLPFEPGKSSTVRFVGPKGSATATIFPGEAAF
jgi:hypothetical protein